MQRENLDDIFAGGVICGDQHFEMGRRLFENIKFHVPIKAPAQRRGAVDLAVLTAEQQLYNKAVRTARNVAEQTFAHMRNMFAALHLPWAESDDQLDCVVFFAAGIHNFHL